MLFRKVYTITIDILDTVNYCAQSENYIHRHLNRCYVGRCWGAAYIVEILRVLKVSPCRIKTDLSAEGYVDVAFEALVDVCEQWDIITGVKIADKTHLIVGRSNMKGVLTIVNLLATPQAETVQVGQIIPVRVAGKMYVPNQAQVTVVGAVLTCDRMSPVFHLKGVLTKKDVQDMSHLVENIKELMRERAALLEKRRADVVLYDALLYTYSVKDVKKNMTIKTSGYPDWSSFDPKISLPGGVTAANMLELVSEAMNGKRMGVEGYWCRDLALHRSSPLASVSKKPVKGWGTPVESVPRTAFAQMLKSMYNFLKAVNEMVETYSREDIESHKNLWVVMRGAQLPSP
jgi:hypothetical protein